MTQDQYEKFADLLDDIITEDGKNWQTKRDDLSAALSEHDISNLEELSEWFAPAE